MFTILNNNDFFLSAINENREPFVFNKNEDKAIKYETEIKAEEVANLINEDKTKKDRVCVIELSR
ncbi:MAG: hypothetical protein P1U44_13070 [Vicingaceae bacterium]|nr:hypothetical protein [Vicingaceae bacterium]